MIVHNQVELTVTKCTRCGTIFAVDADLDRALRTNGAGFYCPNGHPLRYGPSTDDQLKQAQQALKQAQEDSKWWQQRAEAEAGALDATKRTLRVTRSNLTRTKKRLAAGICPCCEQQFVDLQRHMASQHPDYAAEPAQPA